MRLKRCTADAQYHIGSRNTSESGSGSKRVLIDRLTTLPVELLIRILSLLPTKDAAVVASSSKRLLMSVFPCITTLDFDDSPAISHCLLKPCGIERFPSFVAFVDSVLLPHRPQPQPRYLTSFRLGVGPVSAIPYTFHPKHIEDGCEIDCFPDLKSKQIDSWISFPLSCCGLKQLDLRIHVREEGGVQLPSEIFTCQTLEVLKLDVNLGLDQVSTMPSYCLPNLKLLDIAAIVIPGNGFVTRLVSSCPLLEDLTLHARWHRANIISISSPSLRRICFEVHSHRDGSSWRDLVLIHAPNLEYLAYFDDLASQYSFVNMDCLVKACIGLQSSTPDQAFGVSAPVVIELLRPLSNVQHLRLDSDYLEELSYDEVKVQLPEFSNLKCLELCYYGDGNLGIVLPAFLSCSPTLETLVFPAGLNPFSSEDCDLLEQLFCKKGTSVIPSCCRYHLKRIEIKNYKGSKRDIDLIQVFLRCALVLKELVLFQCPSDRTDQGTLESALQKLPRASITCSIQVV